MVSNPKKLMSYPKKRVQFYTFYAWKVSEILRKPVFQRFLHWIIRKEKIEKKAIKDIQVRMFPFKKENGKLVAGRCRSDNGVILIFPKKQSFFHKKLQSHKKKKVQFYLKSRAMATLIHEILHIKYEGNEDKVRQLTKKYFGIFMRHQNPNALKVYNVQKMGFI